MEWELIVTQLLTFIQLIGHLLPISCMKLKNWLRIAQNATNGTVWLIIVEMGLGSRFGLELANSGLFWGSGHEVTMKGNGAIGTLRFGLPGGVQATIVWKYEVNGGSSYSTPTFRIPFSPIVTHLNAPFGKGTRRKNFQNVTFLGGYPPP